MPRHTWIALAAILTSPLAWGSGDLCPGVLPAKTGTVLYTSGSVVICRYEDGSITVRNGRTMAGISEGSVTAVFSGSGAAKPEVLSALDRNGDGYLDLVTYDSNEVSSRGETSITDENADGIPDLRFSHSTGTIEAHTKGGWKQAMAHDAGLCVASESTIYAWNNDSGVYEATKQKCSNTRPEAD